MKTKYYFNNLSFEYIHQEHLPSIIKMLAKESVCEHVFFGPNTEEETTSYFQPFIDSINRSIKKNIIPKDHVFIIKHNEEFIGECAVIPIAFTEKNYLIGYQLDDTYWHKGYGTSACEFLVNFAFKTLNAERLTGDCMSGNLGSERIMDKCGFIYEGCQKKYWKKNGKYLDNILFGMLREDWIATQKK